MKALLWALTTTLVFCQPSYAKELTIDGLQTQYTTQTTDQITHTEYREEQQASTCSRQVQVGTHQECSEVGGGQQCHEVGGGQECHMVGGGQECETVGGGQECHMVPGGQECETVGGGQECHMVGGGQECVTVGGGQECETVGGGQVCETVGGGQECHEVGGGSECHMEGGGQQCGLTPSGMQCHDVPGHQVCSERPGRQECYQVPGRQECHSTPGQQVCHQVPGRQECHSTPGRQECYQVPGRQECHQAPSRQECFQTPGHQVCHQVPAHQECYQVPGRQECTHVPGHQQCHQVPTYKTEYYSCTETVSVPYEVKDFEVINDINVEVELNPNLPADLHEVIDFVQTKEKLEFKSIESTGKVLVFATQEQTETLNTPELKKFETKVKMTLQDRALALGAFLSPMSELTADSQAMYLTTGLILDPKNIRFDIHFTRKKLFGKDEVVLDGTIKTKDLIYTPTADGTQTLVTFDFAKLGILKKVEGKTVHVDLKISPNFSVKNLINIQDVPTDLATQEKVLDTKLRN